LGGILPAIFWLWFWLKEDKEHPEPRRLIIRTFIAGMIAVPLVIPFQAWVKNTIDNALLVVILWAAIEEILKLLAAYSAGLSTLEDDEPIDPIIYMITAALGFAAVENALFILTPLQSGHVAFSVITDNLRFVGAMLLHIVASASIGVSLGLSFYKKRLSKIIHCLIGLGIATALHSAFNFFIITSNGNGTFAVFYTLWIGIIILVFCFEKVKAVRKN
jgi:RsiW-degrading membrane proteinase PrsW (M82 family)